MYQLTMIDESQMHLYNFIIIVHCTVKEPNNYRFTICIFNKQKSTKILSILYMKHVQKYYPSSVNDFHLNQLVYENREQISISKFNQVTYNVYDTTK